MTRGTVFGIIDTKTSSKYTLKALESFFKHTKLSKDDEFVLVDNDAEWIQNYNHIAKIDVDKIIVNSEPKNTSYNINQIIQLGLDKEKDILIITNDVVFTPNWFNRLIPDDRTISIPSCNQTHEYGIPHSLSIEDFSNYGLLNTLAHRHHAFNSNPFERLVMPTYVCRIPYEVAKVVGLFDDVFNVGGEDVDYRIRALRAGFDVKYCSSFLLHFNGKSSWNGVETPEQTRDRDIRYRTHFKQKWGEDLFNLCITGGNPLVTLNKYSLHNLVTQGKFNELILKVANG